MNTAQSNHSPWLFCQQHRISPSLALCAGSQPTQPLSFMQMMRNDVIWRLLATFWASAIAAFTGKELVALVTACEL